jgi:predicted dehydrogenase
MVELRMTHSYYILPLYFSKKGAGYMVHLALLGVWHVHTSGFLEDALKTGKAELKVVWDDNVERGQAFARDFGVPFESDLDEVLKRTDFEAVMVECATTRHKEVIIKAANAQKHIFSDKALALTVEDCLEIKQTIEAAGVKFMVSLESKTIGAYRFAKSLVDQGKLGKVTSAYFRRVHQAALDSNMLPSYWFDKKQTGGGATLDLGCHGLYLLPHFCGAPKKVTCIMNELYATGSDENSTTIIEFENGAIGTSHTSFVASRLDNLLEIIGTEGSLIISGTEASNFRVLLQSKHVKGHEILKPVEIEDLPEDDESPSAQFIRLVLDNHVQSHPDFNMEEAIGLTRLIECAYQSAREDKTVFYI